MLRNCVKFAFSERRQSMSVGTSYNRAAIPAIAMNSILIFILSFFFLALCDTTAAAVLLAVCGFFLVSSFRGTPVIRTLILLTIFLVLFTSIQLTAFLISIVTFIALTTVFLRFGSARRYVIVTALCVVSGVGIYFLTGYLSYALSPLIAMLGAVAASLCGKKRVARSFTIAISAAAVIIPLVIMFIVTVFIFNGELSVDIVKSVIDGYREELVEMLVSIKAADYIPGAPDEPIITAELAGNLAATLFNTLPGFLVVVISVMMYFSTFLSTSLTVALRKGSALDPQEIRFRMSAVSAVFFLISFVVYFFSAFISSDTAELVYYCTLNLNTVLLPGMIFTAITYFRERMTANDGVLRINILTVILLVALIFFFTSVAFYLIACYGAICSVREEWKSAAKSDS